MASQVERILILAKTAQPTELPISSLSQNAN
jgi:hypothetical protein